MVIRFESAILSLGLFPDSRGMCQFHLEEKEGLKYHPISSTRPLTCEYLTDLHYLTILAVQWVLNNCEDVQHEGRHVYWKFRTVQPPPPAPKPKPWWNLWSK